MEITFTRHKSGGWVRTYKGRTVWCGGKNATPQQIEDTFAAKRKAIDADEKLPPVAAPLVYRELLSKFIAACEDRVATRKMAKRTLHNYVTDLNAFGLHIGGSTPIADIGPEQFGAYAKNFHGWKASGIDSVVCRVGALFRWAVEMEYIDRYRPGPQFQRPAKSEIRDQRIDLSKSFTPEEVAKLYAAANPVMRCWVGLGVACAFNNSEVAHLERSVVDLESGCIDFRRRKTGKVRRVCPLPDAILADLKAYRRPEPVHADDAGLFFVSEYGNPYSGTRHRDGKPSDTMSRLFRELMIAAKVEHRARRGFSGLRTTFFNLCPRDSELERKIIMGRAQGTIDLDHYLEDVGLERLKHVVGHVWGLVAQHFTSG
jgi:integrase